MIRLNRLTFCNIGRFTTPQEIDFTQKSNLIQIDARNINTGGSSGSGKSTLFNAIDYVLGINETPATELQSRITKEGITGSINISCEEAQYLISRSKKNGLNIFKVMPDGTEEPVTTNSSKVAEETLDKILGIPRDLVAKLVHKKQDDGGFFLNLRPKECYDFLIKCMGLEDNSSKIVALNEEAKKIDAKIIETSAKVVQAIGQSESITTLLASRVRPAPPSEITVSQLSMANLVEEIKNLEDARDFEVSRLVAPASRTASTFTDPEIAPLEKDVATMRQEMQAINAEASVQKMRIMQKKQELVVALNNCKNNGRKIPQIQSKIADLDNEIKHILEATCPKCLQKWAPTDTAKRLSDLNEDRTAKSVEMANLRAEQITVQGQEEVIARIDSILASTVEDPRLAQFRTAITNTELIIGTRKAELGAKMKAESDAQTALWIQYNQSTEAIKQSYKPTIDLKKAELNAQKSMLQTFVALKNAYTDNVARFENEGARLVCDQKTLGDGIVMYQTSIKSLDQQKIVLQESARFLKSYSMAMFQDSLDYIGKRGTQMLSQIPHVSNCVISFEIGKENKDGTIKEEITPYVNLEGDINIPVRTLSGGERSAVDLAIDLAVNDLIESRSAKGFDWVVLDEPFNGNDTIGKNACLELLTNETLNRRVVIVDHGTELKERLSDKITVVREGETSNIL